MLGRIVYASPWLLLAGACAAVVLLVLGVRAVRWSRRGARSYTRWEKAEVGLAALFCAGTMIGCSTWFATCLDAGGGASWTRVDSVLVGLLSGWPLALRALTLALCVGCALAVWSAGSRRSMPVLTWVGLSLGLLGILLFELSAERYLWEGYQGASSYHSIRLSQAAAAREQFSLRCRGAAAAWLLGGLMLLWSYRPRWARGANRSGGSEAVETASVLRSRAVTLGIAVLGGAAALALWRVGSMFASENLNPLDPGYSYANASLGFPDPMSVEGTGPHQPVEAPLVIVGGRASVDGVPVNSETELRKVLEEKRRLWTELNPGERFPGFASLNTAQLSSVRELEASLALVLDAGYDRPVILFSQRRVESRPVLGPLQGTRVTALVGETARDPEKCSRSDVPPVQLSGALREPLRPWLHRTANRHDASSFPCFVVSSAR